jgi:hypothetical protein
MDRRVEMPGVLALASVFALMGVTQAHALESCSGKYSSALLHPLAEPPVVTIDLADSSDVNTRLAGAFTSGLREAGVAVGGQPTIRLRLSYQVVGQGGGNAAGPGTGSNADTGWSSWSGGDAASLQGGQTLALPDLPNYDAFSPQQPVQSALLMFRVEARNVGAEVPSWVAWMQCTMQGTDNQTLAYQLGYLMGGAFGKRRDNVPM